VYDAIEPDGGVAQSGQHADDDNVTDGQLLGAEQVAKRRQVEAGELEQQCGRDGHRQQRVGPGAGAGAGADRHRQLGGAEREERHALPRPSGGMAPTATPRVTPAITTPTRVIRCHSPAPSTLPAGERGGRRMTPSSAGSLPNATPGRLWRSMAFSHRIWAGSSGSARPRNGPASITAISAAPPDNL
jgi:hypothetical protein